MGKYLSNLRVIKGMETLIKMKFYNLYNALFFFESSVLNAYFFSLLLSLLFFSFLVLVDKVLKL